jgi:glutamate decarboxylase
LERSGNPAIAERRGFRQFPLLGERGQVGGTKIVLFQKLSKSKSVTYFQVAESAPQAGKDNSMTETTKSIKANLEYLRKLFIMPDSPDKFIEFGHELLEMIHDFFQEKGGIHSSITLPELSKIFNQTAVPGPPHLIKDVLSDIKTKIIDHSVKVGNPYYIGHMTSAIPYFMILLEMIIAALNQNQVKIETAKASSFVERELVAWLHRLVFNRSDKFYEKNVQNPRVALGNVTSGGTIANLTALLVARERAFPPEEDFPGLRAAGVDRALRHYNCSRGVIIVSTRGHYSIRKAANLLGIGEENVLTIPVDNNNRIDLKKLRRRLNSLQEAGNKERTKIIAIVGIAGTTETGNVDNLEELGEISRNVGAYFHVDACWGGAALLVDEYRPVFKGLEMADSVSIDAHKLLYCPMTMGIVLFRNEKDLNSIRHSSQYIIRKNSVDTGRFTIEGSRPFACLKPWASLKVIGREGYGLLFKHAHESTKILKRILDKCGNFETLGVPELFILNYRFVPQPVREHFLAWESTESPSKNRKRERKIGKINQLINALNIKLHKALRRDDTSFVSRTTLESTRYKPNNIVVLRAVLINPLTDKYVLKEIVDTQNRIGLQIWGEFEPAYQRILKEPAQVRKARKANRKTPLAL